MVKASRPGSPKAGSNDSQTQENAQARPAGQQSSTNPQAGASASAQTSSPKKGKQSSKHHHAKIGGTAVTGAKSTLPKELSTGSPANQQPEYYNRDTRRRMEHMGTGPYAERAVVDPRERRKRRQERLQERQERIKQMVNAKGPSRDVKLGKRNTYFLIGLAVALVVLFAVYIIVRHPF